MICTKSIALLVAIYAITINYFSDVSVPDMIPGGIIVAFVILVVGWLENIVEKDKAREKVRDGLPCCDSAPCNFALKI